MKKVLLGILYWIDQLTWGLLMTFIGAITGRSEIESDIIRYGIGDHGG